MQVLRQILHFLWGLPQNIVGGILYFIYSGKYPHRCYKDGFVCEMPNPWGSISLGMFCLVQNIYYERTVQHEYGHSIQSMIFGPLYFLIVGLPSLIWAGCFDKYRQKHGISYYSFYTEKYADKFGGVKRK